MTKRRPPRRYIALTDTENLEALREAHDRYMSREGIEISILDDRVVDAAEDEAGLRGSE